MGVGQFSSCTNSLKLEGAFLPFLAPSNSFFVPSSDLGGSSSIVLGVGQLLACIDSGVPPCANLFFLVLVSSASGVVQLAVASFNFTPHLTPSAFVLLNEPSDSSTLEGIPPSLSDARAVGQNEDSLAFVGCACL